MDVFTTFRNGKVYAKRWRLAFLMPAFGLWQVWRLEQLAKAGQNVSTAGQGGAAAQFISLPLLKLTCQNEAGVTGAISTKKARPLLDDRALQ